MLVPQNDLRLKELYKPAGNWKNILGRKFVDSHNTFEKSQGLFLNPKILRNNYIQTLPLKSDYMHNHEGCRGIGLKGRIKRVRLQFVFEKTPIQPIWRLWPYRFDSLKNLDVPRVEARFILKSETTPKIDSPSNSFYLFPRAPPMREKRYLIPLRQ